MEKKKLNIILIWFVIIFTLQLTVGLKSLNAQFSLNNPLNISEDVEQIDLVDVPTRITDQVLILFVDGMRYDKMLEANTPNMDALRANGTTFSNYFSEYPSYSTVNYAAFSTGSSTNYTSVFANAFNEELALPTLYSLIDDPEINKSVITGSNSWMKFFGSFAEVAVKVEAEGYHTLDEGEQIMEAVIQTVPGNFSNIQFIGFEDVDAAGHEVGAASPVYTET
ncbi:MAG: alkaline phosphatase family protein, partial [Candidatus Heimdallarchaeota archaeon]